MGTNGGTEVRVKNYALMYIIKFWLWQNRKISQFTELTAPASTDVLPIIDQSGTGSEKNKKITYSNLLTKAPNGSESSPSFSFLLDPNTGISGGSDTLTLSTNGQGRLVANASGLVTIPGDF